LLGRLARCIDRGVSQVAETQKEIIAYVQDLRAVDSTLDPSSNSCAKRRRQYQKLRRRFENEQDRIFEHMSKVMASFEDGLFAGGNKGDLPRDNLDLERWFRLPKGHERRIHGHCHAGVRIVQEGPTLLLALDAHRHHPEPFTEQELWPYRHATAPECQRQAIDRRKVMRQARSAKKRPLLLKDLETRYIAAS
jgi:hypothetical protein